MLSMGFLPQITDILSFLPANRQTLLFSATLPADIQRMAETRLKNPEFLTLSGDHIGALEIKHFVYIVPGDKLGALIQIIEVENPESAIVFCNTKDETERVAAALEQQGYDADWLNADLAQNDREKVMAATRKGKLRFLVATDVAARGIDISHLTHVINFDFPESAEPYVHRTGRTGRAGRTGTAISLDRAARRRQPLHAAAHVQDSAHRAAAAERARDEDARRSGPACACSPRRSRRGGRTRTTRARAPAAHARPGRGDHRRPACATTSARGPTRSTKRPPPGRIAPPQPPHARAGPDARNKRAGLGPAAAPAVPSRRQPAERGPTPPEPGPRAPEALRAKKPGKTRPTTAPARTRSARPAARRMQMTIPTSRTARAWTGVERNLRERRAA